MRAVVFGALVGSAIAQDGGPVKKVVQLLKDMKAETEANKKKDEETNVKFGCWCKKTISETQAAIDEATDCIAEQGAKFEQSTNKHDAEKGHAEAAEEDIKNAQTKLEEETAARRKDAEDFAKDEKELIKTIGALKSAISVLKKHNSGFLQESSLEHVAQYLSAHGDHFSPSQQTTLRNFLQQPTSAKYGNQSSEIFNLLEQMLIDMSADLEQKTADEKTANEVFATLKKEQNRIIKEKTKLLNGHRLAQAQADEDAQTAKAAKLKCTKEKETATNVLASANDQCDAATANFAHRSKAQAEELDAINQAIDILNSEDAFAAFAKTTDSPATFLQTSLRKLGNAKRLQNITAALKRNAGDDLFKNFGAGRATRIVAMMLQQRNIAGQSDQFNKILEAVGKQILAKKELLKNKADEKDTCVADINKSDAAILGHNREITRLEARIETLAGEIEALEAQIKKDQQEVADFETSTKTLSEDRSEANGQYVTEMEENRAAIALLAQAKDVMAKVFGGPVLLQQDPNAAHGSPEFEKYEQHSGGQKVLAMLDTIVADVKSEMKVAQTAENAAQKAYETQVKDNNDAITALNQGITDQQASLADKNTKKAETEQTLDDENTALTDEKDYNTGRHKACDFLVNNYKAITDAHQEELDGLVSAKTILANVVADLAAE